MITADLAPPLRSVRPGLWRRGWRLRAAAAVGGAVVFLGVVHDAYGGASAGPVTIRVHAGDTLWSIASAHYPGDDTGARVDSIRTANHLTTSGLRPGQTLTLPAP